MKVQIARPFKTLSFVIFLLTIFFLAFFDNSKHIPALVLVNPFADDPYDAVGSFGIQLSFLAAWLSLIRAFRPYMVKEIPPSQQLLILRGETVTLLSILVTLIADIIAMIRYPLMWMNSPSGWILAGLVGGFVLLTILMGLLLYRVGINSSISFANRSWTKIILFPISILVLAVYPADLLESIPAGVFSALLGMIILFISTWALAIGGALMLVEAVNEGISTNMNTVLLILAIFLSIEGMGVILGYYLFAEFLGIFRKE